MADYIKDLIEKAKKEKKKTDSNQPDAFDNQPNFNDLDAKIKKLHETSAPPSQSKSEANTPQPAPIPSPKAKNPDVIEEFGLETKTQRTPSSPDEPLSDEEIGIGERPQATKEIIESIGDIQIVRRRDQQLLEYAIPVPKPTAGEKTIINIIKEAATQLISISPYRIRDPQQRRNVYFQKIMEILRNSPELNIPVNRYEFYAHSVVREMVGYGVLDPLLSDDNIEEIMVIASKKPVYVFHRKYEMMTTNIEFFNDKEIQNIINKIARDVGRRVDFSSPLLDARLPDGSRVNATIPPASVDNSSLTIRKFRKEPYTIVDLIRLNTIDAKTAGFLWLCVEGLSAKPANILIAGGTGSGKTTFLNVMSSLIPERERLVTIEDTAELNLPLQHWIRLEARPPGIEGEGELAMDILTKNALRMRPDRIIVGEVRHAEAATMFTAMNTGHDGVMGTIHANNASETLVRIVNPPMNVPTTMLAGLDFIIVINRIHDRLKGTIRRVTEVAEVRGVLSGKPVTQTLFAWNPITDTLQYVQGSENSSFAEHKTKKPKDINYYAKLTSLTGLTVSQIESEIDRRASYLQQLVKENQKGISQIRELTNQFQQNPKK